MVTLFIAITNSLNIEYKFVQINDLSGKVWKQND